ncbi:MAG: SPOR domain-containing protein, partial [Rhodospirillales bacterium]|nr:SPOR domain-containing protein [Rhodospirillales bacterium]
PAPPSLPRAPARLAYQPPARHLPEPPAAPRLGFRLVPTAYAEPAPPSHSVGLAGGWAVQVGAFDAPGQARHATALARDEARTMLGHAREAVVAVRHGHAVLWRARLTGLSREAAMGACRQLAHHRAACIVLSPDAQS